MVPAGGRRAKLSAGSIVSDFALESSFHNDGEQRVIAADLDGDGDNDILAVPDGGSIEWFENTDGSGVFSDVKFVSRKLGCQSITVDDIDLDGDLDVLGVCHSEIRLFANVDGMGTFEIQPTIPHLTWNYSIHTADMDGDGDKDLVSNQWWFENTNGLGEFGNPQVISDRENLTNSEIDSVLPVDVDNDGDVDIVARHEQENSLWWIENTDGKGTFEHGGTLTLNAKRVRTLVAGDLDGDGDADVVTASSRDGDDTIAWFENTDLIGGFTEEKQVARTASGAESVHAADLDGDGDLDVLTATANDGKIAWHVNEDGEGAFGEQILIDQDFARAQQVHAVDIDNDGDLDVVATYKGGQRFDADEVVVVGRVFRWPFVQGDHLRYSATIRWYENLDGEGDFSGVRLLDNWADDSTAIWETPTLRIEDVDGDGRQDIMAFGSDEVYWYQNLAGVSAFSERQTLTTRSGIYFPVTVDMDKDGDVDFLSTNGGIATLHDNDGVGTFAASQLFSEEENMSLRSIRAADMDGDGDLDVLTASLDVSRGTSCGLRCWYGELSLAWRENTDGMGTMGDPQSFGVLAGTNGRSYLNRLAAVDVDHDGDLDAVLNSSLSHSSRDDKVVWYENIDGNGTFGSEQALIVGTDGIRSLVAADIDSDGDVDFLSASRYDGKIAWYESVVADNPPRIAGDADGDGQVSFADFLVLSENFGRQTDAVWADGDFDGNGEVSFSDFLILSKNFGKTV